MLAAVLGACNLDEAEYDTPRVEAATAEAAGRYLVVAGGCNDCHTPRWDQQGTAIPESEWLTGGGLGWHGPWGTSYAANLRLTVTNLSEDQWVEMLNTRTALPPMPWVNVRLLDEQDQRAIYRYIRSLGSAGEPAPAALPPGVEPPVPHARFVLPPTQ
jgi:mono/diheme cytochrome c family protein